jgi:7-cyano-7-deazaguanine reductase
LKLYLWSFRDEGIFYERAVNRILDDLSAAARPRWIEVVGDFNIRGGIKSVITARVGSRVEGRGSRVE